MVDDLQKNRSFGYCTKQQAGLSVADICRKHYCSEQLSDGWEAKFGGQKIPEAKRLREFERENGAPPQRDVLEK